MSQTQGAPDQRGQQNVVINDFSPGCYDASLTVGSGPTTPATAPGPYPAPTGAADANFTYGCMSLPTGGLGPLPALTQTKSLADISVGNAETNTILCFQNSFQTNRDEIVFGLGVPGAGGGGPNITAILQSALWAIVSPANIFEVTYNNPTHINPNNFLYPMMPFAFSTRMAASDPTITVGQAVVVIPVMTGGVNDSIVVYPDPSAPTVSGNFDLLDAGANGNCGPTFGHQGRVVTLTSEARQWPRSLISFGNVFYEIISYTDPANSEDWPNQQEVFGPENPYGYGAVGSVSAGELFMVKQRGGAIIVQGDLNNPTVTTLPGVKSTGPLYGRAAAGETGMFYCSQDHGAYVWNGGNTSQKISAQLDDNFFSTSNAQNLPCYGYFTQRWGEWMLFSNNWVYNTQTGGWWRLSDPSAHQWFHYTPGFSENHMYAAPIDVTSNTDEILGQFDNTVPTDAYVWQCLPIRPNAIDRTVDVREVTVRASNPTLDPGAVIQVSVVVDGQVSALEPWPLDFTTPDVQIQSLNAGGVQADDIVVRLECSGDSAAPIVYDLNIGYRTRQRASVS
jgi:hypothetical protein